MAYIRTLKEIDREDLSFAGGKGANLGEIVKIGIPTQPGFVIGTSAYFDFLKQGDLRGQINKLLAQNLEDPERLLAVSAKIIAEFEHVLLPEKLAEEITQSYKKLGKGKVAVRSSSTYGDSQQTSFAGLHETFLNVEGKKVLLEKVRACWASFFNSRAIFYRIANNFEHFAIGFAVVVQKMVQSEVSGVMFTVDPLTLAKDVIVIEAAYGLGKSVVGGQVTPDQYQVRKSDGKILNKRIFPQNFQFADVGGENKQIPVSAKFANLQKLSDESITELANYGKLIEKHYYFPQDIEWAKSGGKIFILQTRPITTLGEKGKVEGERDDSKLQTSTFNLPMVLQGTPASPGIATGHVKILESATEVRKVARGDVLVTAMTNPDYLLAMKKSSAIVTDKGGRTSHAAIVSRELGIPAVVGTETATQVLKNRLVVTVDGSKGQVFKGTFIKNGKTLAAPPIKNSEARNFKTVTKIYVNLAEPEKAVEVAKLDVDGVGLLRAEFMIAEIGIHPKQAIAENKARDFVKKLFENLLHFAKSFAPRPVIYRASDFKTSEYRNLLGGEKFEPAEPNPMIGFRGAARFLAQPEVFNMELEAVKRVYKLGFTNLKLMIPFVRTPEELLQVKSIVEKSGLTKFADFELWMMAEVPSNVLVLPQFLDLGINGVSIGSNDLTMLILGVDRDNEQIAANFTEMDPAVLTAFEKIITTCKTRNIPCSICGQAPSIFDELVKKLVLWGITSISVSPDAVERVRQLVYQTEFELATKLSERLEGKGERDNSKFKPSTLNL